MWPFCSLPLGKPVAFPPPVYNPSPGGRNDIWFRFTRNRARFISGVGSSAGFPKITTVEPDMGKVGDIISAKCENLDKSSIGDVYLTDGSRDVKVPITAPTETEVKFRVPEDVKAGPASGTLLQLARKPKWRILTQPGGRICRTNRRMNSMTSCIIRFCLL